MIARILFSACWNLLWWIKTNLVWRWQMQWLQEYYFLYVGTLCDASKPIFLEVMYAVIARVLFSSCWDILWCIKTNLVWRCQMQWLQEYSFSSCLDIFSDLNVFWMLQHCVMHQDKFSFQVLYAVFARVWFPSYCDASKHILFWSLWMQ